MTQLGIWWSAVGWWDGCWGQIKLTFRAGTHFQRPQWGNHVKHTLMLAELNGVLCSKTLNLSLPLSLPLQIELLSLQKKALVHFGPTQPNFEYSVTSTKYNTK